MRRQAPLLAVVSAALMLAASGCYPQQFFYFSNKGDTGHYVGVAQQIEYPDLERASLDEVNGAKAPLTLENAKPESYWDLSLEEAMRIALENGTVLKTLGPAGAFKVFPIPDQIMRTGGGPTIYMPALTEADPGALGLGVEAALSAFDAQLSSSIFWENNVVPENSAGFVTDFRPTIMTQQTATATTAITKTAATGDQFQIKLDTRYNKDNTSSAVKRFAAEYDSDIQFQFIHPFLRGAGVGFNRIAGPGAQPGQAHGVMIARVRTDQSLADFEAAVRNMVNDVERAYWYLSFQYRRLDAMVKARDAALNYWRTVKARADVGGTGGSAGEEGFAREQYLRYRALVESAQSDVYAAENRLRYVMGLTHSDGRLIRPADEPPKAKVDFDWYDAHAEALTRFVEIRKQKWVIKQREMELVAAKNYLLPQLNAVGRYGWNGMGDLLIDPSRSLVPRDPASGDFTLVPRSAFGSMTTGDFPAWHLELQFAMPFGFRREMAGVRYAQLNLVRERKVLQEMELELSHQLADAFRDLAKTYDLTQTYYNRWLAAQKLVEANQAEIDAGKLGPGDLRVFQGIQSRAEAENEFYSALADYAVAITQIHFRKGSLLEYNGIYLAEGPWPAKAYFDARRRARHADASHYVDYGYTQPRIVSQGAYDQFAGQQPGPEGEMPVESPLPAGQPGPAVPEPIRSPSPLPMSDLPSGGGKAATDGAGQRSAPQSGATDQGTRVVPGAKVGQNGGPRKRGYDLASMNIQGLGSKAVPAQNAAPLPVAAASFQQAAPRPESAGVSQPSTPWKSVIRSVTTHEPDANPSPPAADPSASGWKSVQH